MLDGEPLREDASLRDFNGGVGCRVTSALEETLLLPKDMAELRGLKRNEVIQNTKRYLGMAVQATFRLEEINNACYQQIDDERKRRATAVQTLTIAEQTAERLKKKQAENQRKLLRDANAQLATSKEQISSLQKQLEEAHRLRDQAEKAQAEVEKAKAEVEKERDAAEQRGYDVGIAETEEKFRAEVPMVCRVYSIRAPGPSAQQEEAPSAAVESTTEAQIQVPSPLNQHEQSEVLEGMKDMPSDKGAERPEDGAASQSFEHALASTTLPVGENTKAKEKDVPSEATDKAP
nr:uncharacterized protein LOC111988259 [Quercus suber]